MFNAVKKMSAILMSVIVCSTSIMSGYADESLENSSTDKIRGSIEILNDGVDYEENNFEVITRVATSADATPTEATPLDTILKDENGNLISGKWKCENGIILELADKVLTISGNSELKADAENIIHKIRDYKCIINEGITGISNIFSGGKTGASSLNSIELPNSMTRIEKEAFRGCPSLSSIKMPNSITYIGYNAFGGCLSLSSIKIPDSVIYIDDNAFNTCNSLITITNNSSYNLNLSSIHSKENNGWYLENTGTIIDKIANGQTAIYIKKGEATPTDAILKDEDGMITSGKWKCENGITVELAGNILEINGNGIPREDVKNTITKTICKSDKYQVKCIINEGITEIPEDLFLDCKGLREIEIPSSVTNIGEDAFKNCNSLSSIKVAEGNKVYDSRDNCNAIIKTETNELIRGCYNTKIPDSVTSIGYGAFKGCNSLTAIEIPNSVISIKANAFFDCSSLKSIEIPETVTTIMYGVVSGCSNLKSIKVAENNKVYDSRDNCNAIIVTKTNVLIAGCGNTKIPNSVIGIGNDAFYNCSSLTSIEIPSSVTKIELGLTNPFDGCKNLKRFTNNSSVAYVLNQSIHGYGENGQWYLENTNTIIDKIANGQTAIYKKIGEDGKPIEDVKYGDINADGEINIQDGVLLKKHLAGIKGIDINLYASDVNVDGEVNIQDAVILLKHLAGMDVTLGKE